MKTEQPTPPIRGPVGIAGGCSKCGGFWMRDGPDEWCLNCGASRYRSPGLENSDEDPKVNLRRRRSRYKAEDWTF